MVEAASEPKHRPPRPENEQPFPGGGKKALDAFSVSDGSLTLSAASRALRSSRSFFRLVSFLLSWEPPWLFSSAWFSSLPIFFRASPEPFSPPVSALQVQFAGPPQRLGARK